MQQKSVEIDKAASPASAYARYKVCGSRILYVVDVGNAGHYISLRQNNEMNAYCHC